MGCGVGYGPPILWVLTPISFCLERRSERCSSSSRSGLVLINPSTHLRIQHHARRPGSLSILVPLVGSCHQGDCRLTNPNHRRSPKWGLVGLRTPVLEVGIGVVLLLQLWQVSTPCRTSDLACQPSGTGPEVSEHSVRQNHRTRSNKPHNVVFLAKPNFSPQTHPSSSP